MGRRWFALLAIALFGAMTLTILWAATEWAGPGYPLSPVQAASAAAGTPAVAQIGPATAPNDLDTPVVITGTGFASVPTVTLGSTLLEQVGWVSSTALTASVPWGLDPGVYTLTVINPDGLSSTMQNAFTVTQGIGVWTTGGPYGGNVHQLTLHPITPTTIYAAGSGGLFVSRDAMAHWELLLPNSAALNLSLSPPEPEVLYFGSIYGLYRSMDGGQSWEDITIPRHENGQGITPLAHPTMPRVLYAILSRDVINQYDPYPSEHTGVFRSENYGTTWVTMTHGLTDTQAMALAFYPDDPTSQRMVLATANGNIFTSHDGGASWQWAARPCDCILDRLVINPQNPQEVWVGRLTRADIMVYKSLDAGLSQWSPVDIDQDPNVWEHVPIFDPWGTLWSDVDNYPVGFFTSIDGGVTWQPMTTTLPNMTVVAFDPGQPDLIYAGSNCDFWDSVCGMYKSTDRGVGWQQSIEGFSGIDAYALAVSPADPQQVYAYTCMRGLMRSNNGGASWQQLNVNTYGYDCNAGNPHGLAVDPVATTRVYLGGSTGPVGIAGLPAVEIVAGDASDWHTSVLPQPDPPEEWNGLVYSVAPHPLWPGRVLASIHYYHMPYDPENPQHTGGLAISHDFGESWSQLIISDTIDIHATFSFDAVDPDLVYAAMGAGPMLKSTDGGEHWQVLEPIPAGVDCRGGRPLAHPHESKRVLAVCSKIMRSFDAGATWTVTDREIWSWGIYAPTVPATLYWREWLHGFGLVRSLDDGETWEPVGAVPDDAIVFAMASGRDERRVMVYVSITGGFAAPVSNALGTSLLAGEMGSVVNAGVYRLTTVRSYYPAYLPLLMR